MGISEMKIVEIHTPAFRISFVFGWSVSGIMLYTCVMFVLAKTWRILNLNVYANISNVFIPLKIFYDNNSFSQKENWGLYSTVGIFSQR